MRMKATARGTAVLLSLALVLAAPGSSAWANAAKAAGAATHTALPRVTMTVGAPSLLTGPASLSVSAPVSLNASVSAAPALQALAPAAVIAAADAPVARAVLAPLPASAADASAGPVTVKATLDAAGQEAASLGSGVESGEMSAGDAKTRAAFELRTQPRSALGDVTFAATGLFGRGAPRLAPVSDAVPNDAPRSDLPAPKAEKRLAKTWDAWTQRLTDFAAVPFLLLQAPQIWANVQNLSAGAHGALANLPWMGYSTGILGNMLLLSWFAGQKEKSAARVQAIGVLTSAVVVAQIYMAGHMPFAAFALVMPAIAAGLALNWLKFKDKAPAGVWNVWSKGTSLLGLVVLPQVLWVTFAPAEAFSYLPAIIAGVLGLAAMRFDAQGKLPSALKTLWANLGAWTATLLFMYGPIAQLMANVVNPAGMSGIAIETLLLAMAGNLLMLPRAMHTKNAIWVTGSAWGVLVGGWAVMLTMFVAGFALPAYFWAATAFIPAWLLASYLLTRASK